MIDKATIDRIYAAADIVEVVGDFVSLRKKGVNYQACCPFHNEKTPSFVVSPTKGLFKCFGCGKGGNAVTFVMEHEGMSYVEALKYVAKLTQFHSQFRAVGTNYNQVVKELHIHFSQKNALNLLGKLEQLTAELYAIGRRVIELSEEFCRRW